MSSFDQDKQLVEDEEILRERFGAVGFAKSLFLAIISRRACRCICESEKGRLFTQRRDFCQQSIDPNQIDWDADIYPTVIAGLGCLGVLGVCLSVF